MGNVRNIGRANLAKMGVNAWAGLLIKRERRDNSRFVAPDLPGFGFSVSPALAHFKTIF
jgi:pimeloyl-ACP methyl ester carboxylesterase